MTYDSIVGGYITTIDISKDISCSGDSPFGLVSSRYPGGFPRVNIKEITAKSITISSDANPKTGYLQWIYINK